MDEIIENTRLPQGRETFDDTYLTELCVKQKYMGHRNARYGFQYPFRVIFTDFNY